MQSFYEKVEGGNSIATLSSYERSVRAQKAYEASLRRIERRILIRLASAKAAVAPL